MSGLVPMCECGYAEIVEVLGGFGLPTASALGDRGPTHTERYDLFLVDEVWLLLVLTLRAHWVVSAGTADVMISVVGSSSFSRFWSC